MNKKQKIQRKAQLILEYGSCCWWCGCNLPPEKLTLDHLKPSSRGGTNSLENLRLACSPCNSSRGNSLFPPKHRQILLSNLGNTVSQDQHASTFGI
ncbi:MAG: HNH endonuclease [Desertifilum sp. SIO1I2]|nr:HNH endonuclease [Desertifilum sp. SIO1I2]